MLPLLPFSMALMAALYVIVLLGAGANESSGVSQGALALLPFARTLMEALYVFTFA